MNAAELAERLSRPAPRFLIALDVPPESRAQLAADQQHQFERGLLLWGRTGHQQAMDLMRETLAVLGSLQRDPVARQFCWLAEGALESCKDRSPATREILNALSQQVRSLATQTFTLPEALALSLWQRISVTGGGETAAALRRHLNAPAPAAPAIPTLNPVDAIPTVDDAIPPPSGGPAIPTLDPVDTIPTVDDAIPPPSGVSAIPTLDPVDAIPTIDDIAPPQPDADIPDLSLDWAVPDAGTDAPVHERLESVRWVAPSSSYALPTRMEVPPLLPINEPAAAIPELSIGDALPATDAAPTADIPELSIGDALPATNAAPAADIPELSIGDALPATDAAPAADIPELSIGDALPTASASPAADIPELSIGDALPTASAAPAADIPELSIGDALPTASAAPAAYIPELSIGDALPAADAAPTADIPELSIGDALPTASAAPAADIPELSIGDALPTASAAPAAYIPELSIGDALPAADTAPETGIPELTIGDALPPTDDAPTAAIPELSIGDALPATDIPELSIGDECPAADAAPETGIPESPRPVPAPLPELPLIASAPFAAPRQALSIEPHPQAAVFAALAAALQSNWQRIANGSTSHFNLFRDALVTLNDGLPSLGTPALARLASALLTHADELPVCGPAADEGERVAEALDNLTDCLKRWPKLGEDDIEALEAHQRALTEMPQAGTPLPEGELQQLAADMQSLSATPADPVPAPPPAPASISLAEVPHLYAAPTDADVPSNAAIERAALGVAAQAHLTELIHGRSRASAGGGIDNDMVQAAQALAAEAEAAGETALGSLAAAFAAALDASRFHPEPVLEIGADIIAVLVDMIGSVQRGEPVEGAEDLVEVLVELTPKAPPSLSLPEEPAAGAEQEQEPVPAPAASPAPAFELPDLSFDEEVMPPSAMEPEPEPDTPWPDEMPDLGDDLTPR
ncbi:hypothetical protein DAI18_06135 [Microvirgula aerodenitrificans]|uniref:Scaffold protein FimL second domain-containing protein n=2 Tax=Microvirgula aerodenitrificans TaxID=57480 RepID=A0A2S0P8E4_9NEIS|nr:hypothetical protein DAI18_06135 [Microvirgula aerodenitrificans]